MRVLVSCDSWCCKLGSDFYLSEYDKILVNRYLMAFDSVRFIIRTKPVRSKEDLGKYKCKVSDSRVEIFPITFFQGPKQYARVFMKIKGELRHIFDGCEIAILRMPSTIGFAVWNRVRGNLLYAVEVVADCYDISRSTKSVLHKILWYRMYRQMVNLCRDAIGVSCVTRDYLQTRYTSKVPGAVFSHYSSIEMLSEFRYKARNYPEKGVFEVILVANKVYLNSMKGHKMIIDVFRILKDRGYKIKLTLVGDDYLGGIDQIRKYARSLRVDDCVHFTGFVGLDCLRKLLLDADILVLPTLSEGLPRAIIEGMALGLPCVATPVSGNLELIDKEFLVDYSDVEAFADRIGQLIKNKKLYESQSSINYNRSAEYCKEILDERRMRFFAQLQNKIKEAN